MHEYRTRTSIMVLMAASLAFAGCSKPPAEATPEPAAQEPAAQEPAAQEPVGQEPAAEKVEPATQAATIAGYIDERPECAAYREQLATANPAATSAELVAVLEKAHKAGCSKKQ
jgi:hypothetical protein